MPFINVGPLSSVRLGSITSFTAGPDQATFCPTSITLSATVVGDLTGHTVIWQEVLTYTYTGVDQVNSKLLVPGNVAATFYSMRELVEVFATSNGVGVGTYIVTSATYNGTATELTVSPLTPLPQFMGTTGAFRHAGSASSTGTSWLTPQNQLIVQYLPLTNADGRFRFWLDRGTPAQQYDDLDVFLTPGHIVPAKLGATTQGDPTTFPTCRAVTPTLLPANVFGPCGSDGAEQTVTAWLLLWGDPACDAALVERYLVQESLNGGSTWTTVATFSAPAAAPVTTGALARVVAVYAIPGLVKPATYEGPYGGVLDQVFVLSNQVLVQQLTAPGTVELFGHDSVCLAHHATAPTADPITAYTFTPLTALFYDETNDPALADTAHRAYGPGTYDPVTAYTFTPLTALFYDETNDPALADTAHRAYGPGTYDPITAYTVAGGVVIGG
jgi:hypothetical protein